MVKLLPPGCTTKSAPTKARNASANCAPVTRRPSTRAAASIRKIGASCMSAVISAIGMLARPITKAMAEVSSNTPRSSTRGLNTARIRCHSPVTATSGTARMTAKKLRRNIDSRTGKFVVASLMSVSQVENDAVAPMTNRIPRSFTESGRTTLNPIYNRPGAGDLSCRVLPRRASEFSPSAAQ